MMQPCLLSNCPTPIHWLGQGTLALVAGLGDLTLFSLQAFLGVFRGLPRSRVIWPLFYSVSVASLPVICVTGMFIGMVLAVQSYDTLRMMRLESRIGAVINVSLAKELGPVLTATMLAGRLGSAIAAEIGTMRVTEQIDALRALGADPVRFLVVPRLLACCLLIPALASVAIACGMVGGWLVSTEILGVSDYFFWQNTDLVLSAVDIGGGISKTVFFGAAIALIACHRGFRCGAGAEGVGRAATEAFVISFVAVLAIDFILGVFLIHLTRWLWMYAPWLF